MKAWQINKGATSLDAMVMVEREMPSPEAGEVLIKVRACSINYRDQAIPLGFYMGGVVAQDTVPLSDGVGDIVAVGAGVTHYKVGDKVAGAFFQDWLDGPPNANPGVALGAVPAKGMLAEYVALPERGVVPMAESLTYEEASTLPCAGVTAWNALMEGHVPVKAGSWVAVLGTGGVSLLALQIAKATGARVLVTSSSDGKLARARAMGADATINYNATPDWGAETMRLTGGIDHVIEVGGQGTVAQSMAALGFNGEIAFIGVLSMAGECNPRDLMFKAGRLRGIFVGSAAMARKLNALIDSHSIKPVVDKVFDFADAKAAYAYQASPKLFGKVVISL
jgi:NADPH:quinone reductase-like Zn-dependent oxidoreductase